MLVVGKRAWRRGRRAARFGALAFVVLVVRPFGVAVAALLATLEAIGLPGALAAPPTQPMSSRLSASAKMTKRVWALLTGLAAQSY